MKKGPAILFIVLGSLLILVSLLLLIGTTVGGLIGLAFGALLLVLGIVNLKKAKLVSKQVPEQVVPSFKVEELKVAGVTFYQEALESFGTDNDEYAYTKKQIIDEGKENEQIYEYDFPQLKAVFQYEPDNEEDPNAIAIYVQGRKIGYVRRHATGHIRELIESGRIVGSECYIEGGRYKCYNDDSETIEKGEENYHATVYISIKDDEAVQ